jgi:hypothetical protein
VTDLRGRELTSARRADCVSENCCQRMSCQHTVLHWLKVLAPGRADIHVPLTYDPSARVSNDCSASLTISNVFNMQTQAFRLDLIAGAIKFCPLATEKFSAVRPGSEWISDAILTLLQHYLSLLCAAEDVLGLVHSAVH